MKVNRHTFRWAEDSFYLHSENGFYDTQLEQELQIIEREITSMYLLKQENKFGIKSLGNEIRKNKVLTSIFYYSDDYLTCFKMTENKRAFLHQLVEYINKSTSQRLRVYIFEKDFGRTSRLVDSTFLTISDAHKQLNLMQNILIPRFSYIEIEFIEFFAFSHHIIDFQKKHSQIIRK